MSASLPPDLRVLCRKLTSLPPSQLPHALPSLINHVLHCREPLSASHQRGIKDSSSEAAQLVHKLKASITSLLNGRSREGRFAAIGLIKAVVDVGGWEVLQGAEPWVRGMLSIVKKSDPIAMKELAIVTLIRIYMLVHPYQTLVREIATPTIAEFVTASLVLIKQPALGEPLKAPLAVVETICDSFSALIPLYPTTLRPFSSQIKTAVRLYLSPTQSDSLYVPHGLQRAARHVVICLHHVAAKSGGSDEWAKLVASLLTELHATADQVFRAIDESWEGSNGYARSSVGLDGEPQGGGTSADDLPNWNGLHSGVDRLRGLFRYLSDSLRYPTKAAVTIPTSDLVDAVSRVCLIARLSPKSQTWDQALQTKAAIGREEKEELWSLMPDIHEVALGLVESLTLRLGANIVPLAPELLDHLVRVCRSGINIPSVRKTTYSVLRQLLLVAGPTLSKPSVDMLDPVIGACCRDLQEDAGHLKPANKPKPSAADSKKNGLANVDLFLKSQGSDIVEVQTLELEHKAAATALLAILPSHVPQQHLKPALRGLMDQTAILTHDRDAMLASILNPFKDQRGRIYPSILPHFTEQFPENPGLEILRTNLRIAPQGLNDGEPPLEQLPIQGEEDDDDEQMQDVEDTIAPAPEQTGNLFKPTTFPAAQPVQKDLPIQGNPFEATQSNAPGEVKRAASPPKRRHDSPEPVPQKRQTLEKAPSPVLAAPPPKSEPAITGEDEDDDDDDESVHLNMELEDDEEDDEDDE